MFCKMNQRSFDKSWIYLWGSNIQIKINCFVHTF